MLKKKILFLSDACHVNTGFGGVSRRLLTSWYQSGKYEILHLCQGLQEGHPDLNRTPWKSVGVIPNDPNIIHKMNSDPYYGRNVSYGEAVLEKYVLEFKPDVVILQNDPWGSGDIGIRLKFWNLTNCIVSHTYDSLPLHQPSLDHIDKLKHLYCWSTFAEEEFHRLGHKHVKTQFPPIDTSKFTPLPPETKRLLKQKFGIQDKKFIVNYTFRNQLRKISESVVEAFSILKKDNPEIYKDSWMHFHTHIKEGWDHKRFCKQHNIEYDKILFTWICKNCRELQIKPDNEDTNCPHCRSEKSQETCNVGFGATTEQMNQLYNVANCFTLVANSGATELPGVEAMSAGLPLATIDYAYGHDFIKNDFVFNIKFSKYLEFGTQFIKAHPNASSIADFIKKIYDSTPEQISEISEKSRQWVIDNFGIENVSKSWQNIIDNLPEVTWDFAYQVEKPKNPSFPFPEIEDSSLFVKTLYKEMLNVDIKEDDQGYKDWMTAIASGKSKREIHNFFASVAAGDNSKIQQSVSLKDVLIQNGKKQVLIVAQQSFGDIFMITSLFESLREMYPSETHNLYIACDPQYREILEGNPYIDMVLNFIPEMDNEILMTGQGNNDAVFDEYLHATASSQKFLNYLSRTKTNLNIKD